MVEKLFRKIFFIYLALYPLIPTSIDAKYHICDILIGLFIGIFFIKSIYCKKERTIFKKRVIDVLKDPIVITMVLAIVLMRISSTYARNKVICFSESFRFFTYIILYIAIKYEFNITRNYSKYNVLFLGQSFIIFVLGIIQALTNIGVKVDTNGTPRMESTLGYPTAFAAYIIVIIFPLIMFFVKTKSVRLKVFSGISILCGLISLVLSWSRNGWLALVVGLVVLAIIYNYKFLYAIGAGAVVGIAVPFIRTRLLQLTSMAINGGRIKLWKIAGKMIKEHPVRGVGQGNYTELVNDYFVKYPELYELGHEGFPTHNSYLKVWSELGIIGLIVFFSTYVIMGFKLFAANKKYKNKYLGLTTGVCASFIAFMFINIFDNMMFTPKVMTIMIALISTCVTIDAKDIRR